MYSLILSMTGRCPFKALGTSPELFDGQEAGPTMISKNSDAALRHVSQPLGKTLGIHVSKIFTCLNEVSNSAPLR